MEDVSFNKKQKGFTLIELLVVMAIIGMLLSIILVGMGNARLKGRDAKRLADMQQLKSGMDIYYNLGSGYPDTAVFNTAQTASTDLTCGIDVVMKVPNDLLPTQSYTYTAGGNSSPGCGGTVYTTYKIRFATEGPTSFGPPNTYYLSPGGITTTAPF